MMTWVSLGSLLILVGLAGSGMGAVCQCAVPTWSQRNGAIKRLLKKNKFLRLDLHEGPIRKVATLVLLQLADLGQSKASQGCVEFARMSSNIFFYWIIKVIPSKNKQMANDQLAKQ